MRTIMKTATRLLQRANNGHGLCTNCSYGRHGECRGQCSCADNGHR